MGEERQDAHNANRVTDRLTIAQAAQLLGVHKNTVRNRIKDGTYPAEKILTEQGETYFIERDILLRAHGHTSTNTTLTGASQQSGIPAGVEAARELLRPFIEELGTVREQLGAERARREIAEERVGDLEEEIRILREARESSVTPSEASDGADTAPATGGAQAASEGPWWRFW